ncbi:hypothetical protein PR048_017425 [Dryococelus australis]|uniref:Uncharacterized protein n=1 Tax=Dryococelus australis TaxID=614101 RepID=A0ABQ9H9H0_9NEOP|nr:hypothetical protein PR048_017425 [Dryococelus australis]
MKALADFSYFAVSIDLYVSEVVQIHMFPQNRQMIIRASFLTRSTRCLSLQTTREKWRNCGMKERMIREHPEKTLTECKGKKATEVPREDSQANGDVRLAPRVGMSGRPRRQCNQIRLGERRVACYTSPAAPKWPNKSIRYRRTSHKGRGGLIRTLTGIMLVPIDLQIVLIHNRVPPLLNAGRRAASPAGCCRVTSRSAPPAPGSTAAWSWRWRVAAAEGAGAAAAAPCATTPQGCPWRSRASPCPPAPARTPLSAARTPPSMARRGGTSAAATETTHSLQTPASRQSEEIWAALNIEILRADEGEYGAASECKGWGKRDIPEKTRRPAASPGTIPTCENPEATLPGIEPGSPKWEASNLTTTPPRPILLLLLMSAMCGKLLQDGATAERNGGENENTRVPTVTFDRFPTFDNPGVIVGNRILFASRACHNSVDASVWSVRVDRAVADTFDWFTTVACGEVLQGNLVLAGCCTQRRTQQEPVTRAEPGETECIAATHKRAYGLQQVSSLSSWVSEEIWVANIEVLRAGEGEVRRVWSSAGMKGRGNGRSRENPPTSGILPALFPLAKIRSEPDGYCTRFALVGDEQSNRSVTVALLSSLTGMNMCDTRLHVPAGRSRSAPQGCAAGGCGGRSTASPRRGLEDVRLRSPRVASSPEAPALSPAPRAPLSSSAAPPRLPPTTHTHARAPRVKLESQYLEESDTTSPTRRNLSSSP